MFRQVVTALALTVCLYAQTKPPATIAEKTAGARKLDGYFPLYWDARSGKMWLEISRFDTEFLYTESLATGVGSNDIGLDRGQTGQGRIVKFTRVGPRVLLMQPNYDFRAVSNDPDERQAVDESFAKSVLRGFTVEAEEGDRVLVDATDFFLADVHDVIGALRRAKQGVFHIDGARSAFYLDRTKNFPKNTEVEVTLTFAGDQPGRFVEDVTPTPDAITVREHHSLVELPAPGYRPRPFEPNAGYFGIEFMNFASPLGAPIRERYLSRHRLAKKDPTSPVSDPVQPIKYYLDRGAPEPIRSALLEGARWWNQAFEAAGYRNAFQVELMPEGADMMDTRYNVIEWVHRATRGWSYGASVRDPRTGEIIQGHVTLGSLRARQDYLIAEGWLAPYTDGKPIPPDMERLVLARIRQLAAHEVGHTLGLAHNFAASARNRASVMDYPSPLVLLDEQGNVDLSKAYASGIGDWDKVAIAYGYQDYAPGADEPAELRAILRNAHSHGLVFITDVDARDRAGAHPSAHLWDNGSNAVNELDRLMRVRARALDRFGERNIREGRPMSALEDVLVPLYLSHRYQVEAASKVVGGLEYTYAVRGDGQPVTRLVPTAEQRRAVQSLLATVQPQALLFPERVLQLIPPPAYGFARTREDFPSRTGPTFDPVTAAETAADITISLLLDPKRAARLVEHQSRLNDGFGFSEVLNSVVAATWRAPRQSGLAAEIQRRVDDVVLRHLMLLAADESAATQVRAVAFNSLEGLRDYATTQQQSTEGSQHAHLHWAEQQIRQFTADPRRVELPKPVEPPPGQPIGCEDGAWQR